MANVNLDFSNVRGNDILPEGMYNLTIESIEQKVSSTGKDMLLIRFREEQSKTAIFENYVLQENCLFKLKELLSACGVETDGVVDVDTDLLVGLMVKAKVTVDDYNDNKVNRIKKVYAA